VDTQNFFMVTGVSALVALLVAGLGWVIAKANRRRHERVSAAAAAAPSVNATQAAGVANTPAPAPLWSRAAGWLGIIVLVLGVLVGILALIGASNDGNSQAMTGGFIIMAIAAALWQLLRYVARLGRA
jgi:hypothetical protein